jgi:hypothetical protein
VIADNLRATVGQAQRYLFVALSSAALFAALTLPNPSPGELVKWQLLGVPLSITPPLVLIVLYFIYIGSFYLADNMLIHVGDLADRLADKEEVRAILSYPTVLTASPVGRTASILLPAALVVFGLIRLYLQGIYHLHGAVWWFVSIFAGQLGPALLIHVQRFIVPNLYPERKPRGARKA